MALFTRVAKLSSGAYGARHARVGRPPSVYSSQKSTVVIKPSRLNIVHEAFPIPSLSPYTHLSLKKSSAASTFNTPSGKPDGVALHYTCPTPEVVHWASP